MQTLHYLTLAVLIPPLLALFAEPRSLEYEGGAANVGAFYYVPSRLASAQLSRLSCPTAFGLCQRLS